MLVLVFSQTKGGGSMCVTREKETHKQDSEIGLLHKLQRSRHHRRHKISACGNARLWVVLTVVLEGQEGARTL